MKQYALIVLLCLVACSSLPVLEINTDEGKVPVHIEIADDPAEWQEGLMHRKHLKVRHGMLFIFPTSEERAFWMKDTLIPLDIMFIDENLKVISMIENVQPDKGPNYKTYSSGAPIKYVLEVNAGFIQRHKISVGDSITLPNI